MKLQALFLIVTAIVFIAFGAGAALTCVEGLEDERVVSTGNRFSRQVRKDKDPFFYWANVSFYGVLGVGLFIGSGRLIRRAVKN